MQKCGDGLKAVGANYQKVISKATKMASTSQMPGAKLKKFGMKKVATVGVRPNPQNGGIRTKGTRLPFSRHAAND